jgi:hypothetical protein
MRAQSMMVRFSTWTCLLLIVWPLKLKPGTVGFVKEGDEGAVDDGQALGEGG